MSEMHVQPKPKPTDRPVSSQADNSPRHRRLNRATRLLALSGVVAPLAGVAPVVAASLLTPGYSSIRDSISVLASPGMPYPEFVRASFIAFGLLIMPMTWALYRIVGNKPLAIVVAVFLVISGLSAISAGIFPDDSPQEVVLGVTERIMHEQSARSSFAAWLVVVFLVMFVIRNNPGWRWFYQFSKIILVLIATFTVLFELQAWPFMTGFFERVSVASAILWMVVFSIKLFRTRRTITTPRGRPTKGVT